MPKTETYRWVCDLCGQEEVEMHEMRLPDGWFNFEIRSYDLAGLIQDKCVGPKCIARIVNAQAKKEGTGPHAKAQDIMKEDSPRPRGTASDRFLPEWPKYGHQK